MNPPAEPAALSIMPHAALSLDLIPQFVNQRISYGFPGDPGFPVVVVWRAAPFAFHPQETLP